MSQDRRRIPVAIDFKSLPNIHGNKAIYKGLGIRGIIGSRCDIDWRLVLTPVQIFLSVIGHRVPPSESDYQASQLCGRIETVRLERDNPELKGPTLHLAALNLTG